MDRDLHAHSGRSGFTLMELLAVMMIIGILISTVTAAYVGMQRGAGMREAVNQLRSTIILARQKAITEGGKVNLYFAKNNGVVEYYIVQSIGKTTAGTGGTTLKDYLNPELRYLEQGSIVYNMSTDKSATVVSANEGVGEWFLQMNKSVFAAGQRYGLKLHSSSTLPRGFVFIDDANPERMNMVFFPDGSVTDRDGGQPKPISVYETIDPQKRTITLNISYYGMLGAEESF